MMLFFSAIVATLLKEVHSHGYAWKPASRNAYAKENGLGQWTNSDQGVLVFYNTPGLENGGDTYGACGQRVENSRGFTFPEDIVTPAGTLWPFTSQATYTEGEIIDVYSVITAHHKGHIEMYACTDIENPTDACFHANPMEFIEDPLHGAPKHDAYPGRAYLAPSGATRLTSFVPDEEPGSGMLLVHRFQLPQGLTGDQVLLQWYWVTNLGCRSPGYADYDWPDSSWEPFGSASKICQTPYADCSREPGDPNCRDPQLFRNCIEVTIVPAGPTPSPTPGPDTPSPTPGPITPSPTPGPDTPSPTPGPATPNPTPPPVTPNPTPNPGQACCSANYRDCDKTGWCNESQQNCENCNARWLENGALSGCTGLWERGCGGGDPCCEGASCNVYSADSSMCGKA